MGAIYRREVGAFFTSSIAYVFLAVFYLAAGYFFFGSSLAMATTDMSNLFQPVFRHHHSDSGTDHAFVQ